jgi:beta-phosphoglucomutase-like phosphatase (HAD superfamily)
MELQQRQESQIRVVAAGHAQLVNQISEVTVTLRRQDEKIAVNAGQLNLIQQAVAENTNLTRDVRDAITAGKVAGRLVRWMAATIVTLSAAWLAFKGLIKP